jgi:hypothetical protein
LAKPDSPGSAQAQPPSSCSEELFPLELPPPDALDDLPEEPPLLEVPPDMFDVMLALPLLELLLAGALLAPEPFVETVLVLAAALVVGLDDWLVPPPAEPFEPPLLAEPPAEIPLLDPLIDPPVVVPLLELPVGSPELLLEPPVDPLELLPPPPGVAQLPPLQ